MSEELQFSFKAFALFACAPIFLVLSFFVLTNFGIIPGNPSYSFCKSRGLYVVDSKILSPNLSYVKCAGVLDGGPVLVEAVNFVEEDKGQLFRSFDANWVYFEVNKEKRARREIK